MIIINQKCKYCKYYEMDQFQKISNRAHHQELLPILWKTFFIKQTDLSKLVTPQMHVFLIHGLLVQYQIEVLENNAK